MNAAMAGLVGDIGFRVRCARAVARQIDEVLPPVVHGEHYERHNEAGYLIATVVELLDIVSSNAELLEVEFKAADRQRTAG